VNKLNEFNEGIAVERSGCEGEDLGLLLQGGDDMWMAMTLVDA